MADENGGGDSALTWFFGIVAFGASLAGTIYLIYCVNNVFKKHTECKIMVKSSRSAVNLFFRLSQTRQIFLSPKTMRTHPKAIKIYFRSLSGLNRASTGSTMNGSARRRKSENFFGFHFFFFGRLFLASNTKSDLAIPARSHVQSITKN
jgi:hypothetical protein